MTQSTYKKDFITALRSFAKNGGNDLYDPVYERTGYRPYRGEQTLAEAIANYLDRPEIPGDSLGINWYHDLKEHLVDAFVEFRTDDKWAKLREDYERETQVQVPDLVNVHIGGLYRLMIVNQIAHLCTVLSGQKWIWRKLEAHFHAQQACIDQAWERFVRIGYRELMPRIKEERHSSNRGEFGKTTLMTFCTSGRCMFTFMRGEDGGPSMTYVADDSDMWGVRSGPNATDTPYAECVAMINEVSDNWDIEKMKRDDKIGMA